MPSIFNLSTIFGRERRTFRQPCGHGSVKQGMYYGCIVFFMRMVDSVCTQSLHLCVMLMTGGVSFSFRSLHVISKSFFRGNF